MENLGYKIRKIREIKNLTQAYVADQIGIARESYGRLENGEASIKFEILEKIANLFQIKIEDIIHLDTNTVNYHIENNSGTNVGVNHIDKQEQSESLVEIIKHFQKHLDNYAEIIKRQQDLIQSQEKFILDKENFINPKK